MNERRTAKVSLSKTVLLMTAVLVIWAGSVSAAAQQSFRDIAKEYGCDWLTGQWTAATDKGTEIQLVYKWELEDHLLTVDFKIGEFASRGMIYFVPDNEEAIQISVDNRGGRSRATWQEQDGDLIARSEHTDAEGNVHKSVTVYSKVDAGTMTITTYGLDKDGELNDKPWFTVDFKRKAGKKKDKSATKP